MKRHQHNLSHTVCTSGYLGVLYPLSCSEVLPGDSVNLSTSALVRFLPMNTPVMSVFDFHIHHWFIPNRILWENWADFITNVETALSVPKINMNQSQQSSGMWQLFEHMGAQFPLGGNWSCDLNVLPLRAYNKIWNEYYRDQDIDAEAIERVSDTGDLAADFNLQRVRWNKDYLTAARTQPRKGVGGVVQITSNQFNVETLRQAQAKQAIEEHRSRYGSRYTDYLRFLGVTPSDARLQRPEFIAGGRSSVSVSEVLSTSQANQGKVGQMSGHGIASVRTRPKTKFFEEHGFLMSMMFIRPQSQYGGGVEKFFLYQKPNDFWQKEDELLGMQPVANREVIGGASDSAGTFGWVPRHEHYRTKRSYVSNLFRTPEYGTWTSARLFERTAALNSSFLSCNPDARIFQELNSPQYFVMAANNLYMKRLVSKVAKHS